MQIGSKTVATDHKSGFVRKPNQYTLSEFREAAAEMFDKNPGLMNQQLPGQGLNFPHIASRYGNNYLCENDKAPDKVLPSALFNFDLILNDRRFQVTLDTLIRIQTVEDLAQFSDDRLREALEQCASYRLTCYCAYIAAHRETRRWKLVFEEWMAEKRDEARQALRFDRLADRAAGLRKELGQFTAQEVDDWVMRKYASEYRSRLEVVEDWEENEKVFLEMRDTLKDRGMHLQTLLKRVLDHTDHTTSRGE